MKKQIILLFLISLYFSLSGFSQACGGGKLTFNIYTLNGHDIKEFTYEILPVSKELLKEKFYKKVVNEVNLGNKNYVLFQAVNTSGVIVKEHFASEIIDKNLNGELKKILDLNKMNQTGSIKSSLSFNTLELGDFPIILKISHNEKTIYVLGNYFGGCDREASLVWNNEFSKLN